MSKCDEAAGYLIKALGGEEMTKRVVGGTKWWQVRGIKGCVLYLCLSYAPGPDGARAQHRRRMDCREEGLAGGEAEAEVARNVHGRCTSRAGFGV